MPSQLTFVVRVAVGGLSSKTLTRENPHGTARISMEVFDKTESIVSTTTTHALCVCAHCRQLTRSLWWWGQDALGLQVYLLVVPSKRNIRSDQ